MEGGSMKGEQEAMIDLLQPLQRVIRSSTFPVKLYRIVDDPNTNHILSWGPSGDSLIVWHPSLLAEKVLPMYFNHSNFASFKRQLNIYGFKKIDRQKWEYAREGFKAGQRHSLETIKRQNKPPTKVGNFESEMLLRERSLLRAEVANLLKVLQGMEKHQQMDFLAKDSLNPTVEIDTIQKRILNAISSGGNTNGEAYAAVPFGAIMSDADVGKNWGQLTCEENASLSGTKFEEEVVGVIASQQELGPNESNIAPPNDSTSEFKDLKEGPIPSTSGTNYLNDLLFPISEDEASALGVEQTEYDVQIDDIRNNDLSWSEILQIASQVYFQESSP